MISISGQSYLKFLDLDQSPFIKTTESLLIDTVKNRSDQYPIGW